MLTWLWNIKHKKLIKETKRLLDMQDKLKKQGADPDKLSFRQLKALTFVYYKLDK